MRRIFVSSSRVVSIGYEDGIIEVEFKDGAIYQYYGTDEGIFNEFLHSSSKGAFINKVLNMYNYSKV